MKSKLVWTALGALALPLALTFVLACGGGSTNDKSPTAASGGATSSGSIPEKKITAKDYSYDFPDTVEAGLVKLTLTNSGKEPHQAQLARLNDGVTPQQFQAGLQSPDPSGLLKIVTLMGGPNTIDPGASQSVVDTLPPGQYAMLCFVSGDDGVPHLAKGMVKLFTVSQASAAKQPEPPPAKEKVTLADYNFLGADSLPAGKTTVEVTNGGPQSHELTVIRLKNGVTIDQLKTLLLSDTAPPGPPPIDDVGGIGALSVGNKGWAELDLSAGSYAFLCFVPDAKTGQPHAALGMIKAISVR